MIFKAQKYGRQSARTSKDIDITDVVLLVLSCSNIRTSYEAVAQYKEKYSFLPKSVLTGRYFILKLICWQDQIAKRKKDN